MKIGVLFNCQGQGITAFLQAMLPRCTVSHFLACAMDDVNLAALLACDHIVSMPMPTSMNDVAGPIATQRLRHAAKKLHVVPPMVFRGFHPDTIQLRQGGNGSPAMLGPTAAYHSRIAVAAYLAGLAADDVPALYNGLVFSRLSYMDVYAQDWPLIAERFTAFGIDPAPLIGRLRDYGCFMHSITHPKNVAVFELARMACAMIGETPADTGPDSVPDFLAGPPIHPVFPEIAHRIGIAPEGAFRTGGGDAGKRVLQPVEFVRASFAVYRDYHPDVLRGGDGVIAALAALGLTDAAATSASGRMVFMTRHATLLHAKADTLAEVPAGPIAQLPVAAAGADASLIQMEFNPAPLPAQRPQLGGVALMPAPGTNLLSIRRGSVFLSADPATPKAGFTRDAAGDDESFLPVPVAALQPLRALLSGQWRPVSGAAPGPLPPARMAEGFKVQLGRSLIDLRQGWPIALPAAPGGESRLAVRLDGVPVTLRGPPERSTAGATAVQTEADQAPRLELGRQLAMVGAHAWLQLPLTVSLADRPWLHETCGDPKGLPWEEAGLHVEVRRESGRLLGANTWQEAQPARATSPDAAASPDSVMPTLPGPCALIDGPAPPAGSVQASLPLPWIEPLMRLLTLVPYLPAGAAIVPPREATAEVALTQIWQALGLKSLPWLRLPAPTCVADDLTWLDAAATWQWPAEALRSVRAALLGDAAPPGCDSVFLRGPQAARLGNRPEFDKYLRRAGYTVLDLQSTPAAAMLGRLGQANRVLGVGTDLLVSVFCPPGSAVFELSGEAAFSPTAWRQSCALGLLHAVLPCREVAGHLQVNTERLSALMRVAGQMSIE